MVDGLHIPIRNRRKKPLAIAFSGAGRALGGRDDGSDVTMYSITLIRIATMNPLYNEYILMKIKNK
jgi:hypothetical protein